MLGWAANVSPRNSTIKKFPTALTVPSRSFKVWLTIAPPLEAIVPALGRLCVAAPGVAEIEIAGVDPVLLEEGLDADQLRFDRIAQHGCLLCDGSAAEEDHARQQAREHQTDDRQPQRMSQPDDATEQLGHGIERDTEQHSGKDQKQRRGEIPGEQHQRCKQHGSDTANRYRPSQIVAGFRTIVSRKCHADSSPVRSDNSLSANPSRIKRRWPRWSTIGWYRPVRPAGQEACEAIDPDWASTRNSNATTRSNRLIRHRSRGMICPAFTARDWKPGDEEAGGRCDRERLSHRRSICDPGGRRTKPSRGLRGRGCVATDVCSLT